ncbi:MAG TPA: TIGR03084 family metal-binding protein [Pseudonocardiaceae bacterium]
MAVAIDELLTDLAAETGSLDALLAPLPADRWDLPTPAAGWAIRDQISHLAYFDGATALSVTDEQRFRAVVAADMARSTDFADALVGDYRDMPAAELLTWFRAARAKLIDAFRGCDPSRRLPWYGSPMSVASSITARLMETWAHGQDVADALGVTRAPTARLRHVAYLGVRTLPFSFTVHGLPVPDEPVRVELTAPDGDRWTWGSGDTNRITGSALDFCLVVTQRRNIADTGLVVAGPVAQRWMSVAQAFAGPPAPGRQPEVTR